MVVVSLWIVTFLCSIYSAIAFQGQELTVITCHFSTGAVFLGYWLRTIFSDCNSALYLTKNSGCFEPFYEFSVSRQTCHFE